MEKNTRYVEKFIIPILEKSRAKTWEEAKPEWEYIGSEVVHGCIEECLCGQAIVEICYIRNKITKEEVRIGNRCVNQFMAETEVKEKSERIFKTVKGLKNNALYSVPVDVVMLAYKEGLLDILDPVYYDQIKRKRKLNPKEEAIRKKVNQRVKKLLIKNEQ